MDRATKLLVRKSWLSIKIGVDFFILFVLVDAILLSFTLQKRTSVKFSFKVSTLLPNIFGLYITKTEHAVHSYAAGKGQI